MRLRFLLYAIFLIPTLLSCKNEKVELWDFDNLSSYIDSTSSEGPIKVVNFWATWCAPCIEEMPYFEELNTRFQGDVEVLLVSLDFADEKDQKVIPLIERKKIKSKVVILTDENYNEWIDKVSPSWTGAIPATLFVKSDGDKVFYEKEFEEQELFDLIEQLLPNDKKI